MATAVAIATSAAIVLVRVVLAIELPPALVLRPWTRLLGLVECAGRKPRVLSFAQMVKRGEVRRDLIPQSEGELELRLEGRGVIDAVAAIPFYTRFEEALSLWTG